MRHRTLAVVLVVAVLALAFALALRLGGDRDRAPQAASAADPSDPSAGPSAEPAAAQTSEGRALAQRIAALRREHTGEALRSALVDAIADTAAADPALATRIAAGLEDVEGRAEALHEAFPAWLAAARDEARAWSLAGAVGLPPEVLHGLARDAAGSDPELGLAIARRLPVPSRGSALTDVFGAWTARDPQRAARAVEQLGDEEDREFAATEVARLWTEASPARGFAWANTLHDAASRPAVEASIAAWAASDPEAAARAALTLPVSPWRMRAIDSVASAWAELNPERALHWVQTLPVAAEREAAAATLLAHMSQTEPGAAVEWAAQIGGATGALVTKVVSGWVARDAQAALDWAASRPRAAPHRRALLDLALERWQAQDPDAAASWLRAQRHGG